MLTVVVGGFFGDEGKGKISAYLGLADNVGGAVRCGSINAGHTVTYGARKWKLRIIPSAFLNEGAKLLIPAGALVRLDVLINEIKATNTKGRVFLDFNTGVIEDTHVEREREDLRLTSEIGSTLQGVGAAMCDRALRRLKPACSFRKLSEMLINVSEAVIDLVEKGNNVLIEGTQGTFLSLYHGTYPYVTSRDTTASAFASEVGIGPKHIDEVVVVFKAFMTRVGEGPLEGEILPSEASRRGWEEVATVTGRIRRAAPFNINLAKKAVSLNSATQAAITKVDVLFPKAKGVREWSKLPKNARSWLESLESELRVPISLVGTGPEALQIIDRRKDLGLLK